MKRIKGKTARYDEYWHCCYDPDFEDHGIELDFWSKLDTDVYNWTLKYPVPLGTVLRIGCCILNMNHRNPVPISSSEHVAYLWWSYPQWLRWVLWRTVRNPWEDLRKLYLGFGWAFYADKVWAVDLVNKRKKFRIRIYAPWKIPLFPQLDWYFWGMQLTTGWKKRGVLSLSFRRE